MSSHVPSPTSSPAHGSAPASQENTFRTSMASDPDSSCLSLESSFQLDTGYPSQYEDSQKHPKGKRKRTTTQDKAILEAAYNANPKPDKPARLDLVKRVTLNEKEVQIWFQNRRQNDRRKSRPLSPQEIAQLRFGGGLHMLSSDPPSFAALDGADAVESTRLGEMDRRSPTPTHTSLQEWPQPAPTGPAPAVAVFTADLPKQERRHSEPTSTTLPAPSQSSDVHSEAIALSQSVSSIGYLSNRWHVNESFSAPSTVERPRDEPFRFESFIRAVSSEPNSPPAQILPPPPKSSSQFRISLSLEGKAEIVSSLQSPPRPAQHMSPLDAATLPPVRAPRVLQRSKSALPGITLPPISALTANLPPQLPRGRSRDVSAWESCCDADTRDELTRLAENESSGSAVAAISLLRSSSHTNSLANLVHGHIPSNSNVLKSNSSKRNAAPSRRDSNNKKAKLARSASSVARLQSLPASTFVRPEKVAEEFEPEKKPGKSSLSVILSPSGGDSDKENWSPDEDGNTSIRRRPLPSIAAAAISAAARGTNPRRGGSRVLGDSSGNGKSSKRMLLGGRANTAPMPRLRGGKGIESSLMIFEDGENEEGEDDENEGGVTKRPKRSDEEVERFMRGEVSPSKKGDVDCVAGLLALSQGNWR
ncbi:hypothetical protein SCAR479_11976 [Seiridium cardinale]|uniref:Homeobox domain-containing protein n=1 Tax=Seiridium cardinale TaxID=138064 RepID=A0ABR2XCE3_9PEZI